MTASVELKEDGQQRIGGAKDEGLLNGKQWIENEFWTQLPGKKDTTKNKIIWNYNSDHRQYTMVVEIDGRQGVCDFYDSKVRDCPTDRTVQREVKRLVKHLANSLGPLS